jgi:hypothetical protein
MRGLWWLLTASAVFAADLPRITYSKSFPGSTPAYVAIIIDKSGRAEYREAPDDNDPLLFQLAEKEAGEIFGLAEKLGRFTRPLEANLKVANTGLKTFRYESGQEKQEVKFNYSMDPDARLLWDWFERITESEQHFINLQRAARYDKLGVHKALLLLEASRDRNRLVAAQQFLPLLDRIVKNESYLHMARVRAANLADSFRASPGTGQ